MGYGLEVSCSACGRARMFWLGIGMAYSSLESVIQLVHLRKRGLVLDILRTRNVQDIEYEHVLYACPKCQTLTRRFYYRICYDTDRAITPEFRCGRCRTGLVRADERIEEYRCDACGRRTLSEIGLLIWD